MAPPEVKLSDGRNANDSSPKHAIDTTDAVRYLLGISEQPRIREQRLQGLLFIAEVSWRNGDTSLPLLDTEFKKVRRGVYSQDIRDALTSLDLRSRPSFEGVGRTTVYDISLLDPPENLEGENVEDATDLISEVRKQFEQMDHKEVMKECVQYEVVEGLTAGQVVRFDRD